MRPLLVLNQSQSPSFQRLIEAAAAPAPVCFLNGQGLPTEREGVVIRPAPTYDRRSIPRRAASWLAYLGSALRAGHAEDAFLLAVTNPPFLPHVAWGLARSRRRRYGLLIWDIYPEHLHQIGWLKPSSPISRAFTHLNTRALEGADFVVTLGDRMAETLRRGRDLQNLHVIPNGADTELLRPLPRAENPLRARLNIQADQLVVMYSGNLGATHGLGGLLSAAEALQGDPSVCFRVVASGLGRAALERGVRDRNLSNLTLHDPVSWSDFPALQALADVAVVTQAPGTEHLSVPSKTYSAMAAGAALLALTAPGSDLERLVSEHQLGLACAFNAGAEITQALRRWRAAPSELQEHQQRARALAVAEYSDTRLTARWRGLLQPALSR